MTSATLEPGGPPRGEFGGDPAPTTPWRFLGPTFAVAWLAFLIGPILEAAKQGTLRGDAAAVTLMLYSGAYVVAALSMRARFRFGSSTQAEARRLLGSLAAQLVLAALAMVLDGGAGINTLPYIAVTGAMALARAGGLWVGVVAAAAVLLAQGVGLSWNDTLSLATATLAAGLSLWVFTLLNGRASERVRIAEAERELALESQRGRFARDLHDIVGHSLSVVTLKAGLARRLIDVDLDRARAELIELERLARESLDDVRRAVGGYRDISLPGELAQAREILDAAGVEAEVPGATDDVDPRLRELFAWAVREGVTNVVRHSRAVRCRIELERTRLIVEDDGRGAGTDVVGGHGLAGLAERAGQAGAVVLTERLEPHGFRLTVQAKENA